ncbi:MAG: TIR domain-containing protein [Rhizomicrobium sp.]
MADIFISYAREDREWVEKLATALQGEGYSVWWDWDLLVGKRYRETIESELTTCKATVVVWSQHSIKSDFVRDEAEEGQQRNILVPVIKDGVRPPAGFRQLQNADLSAWTGDPDHVEFHHLMRGVSHLIGRPGNTAGAPPPDAATPSAPETPQQVLVADPPPPTAMPAPRPVVPTPHAAPAGAIPPTLPSQLAAMKLPSASHPVWRYAAIGAVAFVALIYLASQFWPSPKPQPASHPLAAAAPAANNGPAPAAGGDEANTNTGSHPANNTAPPAAATAATDLSGLSTEVADAVKRAEDFDTQSRTQAAAAQVQQKAALAGGSGGGDQMALGTKTLPNGSYAGQTFDGGAQGLGVFTYSNGDVYAGQFDENQISGLGVVTFASTANGIGYSGQWASGNYNGYGVYYFANGTRWEGAWHNGQVNGFAARTGPDGKVTEQGTYANGVLQH